MEEIFKPVVGFDGYFISNMGRVRSIKKGKDIILKNSLCTNGYWKSMLVREGKTYNKLIHLLIAEAFMGHTYRETGLVVDHIDMDINNNSIENLRIITQRENASWKNRKDASKYTSKYVGVHTTPYGGWRCGIRYKGYVKFIKNCNTEEEAANLYKLALDSINEGRFDEFYDGIKSKRKKKTSIFKGVSFYSANRKWGAEVRVNGKKKCVGLHNTEELASEAVRIANIKIASGTFDSYYLNKDFYDYKRKSLLTSIV